VAGSMLRVTPQKKEEKMTEGKWALLSSKKDNWLQAEKTNKKRRINWGVVKKSIKNSRRE